MNEPDSGASAQLEAMGVLGGPILPVVVSTWQRLGLVLGASVSGLFLFVYVALVVLAAWAACSLALRHGVVPGATSGFYSWAGAFTFLMCGCLLILSLLKPLVAHPGQAAEPHFLDPDKEPLLFAFTRKVASSGAMPEPSRIAVDCSVNCCCVLAGGIRGFFRSDLVLQVGLPLVAGLRLDELGGVLAHELGHAAQTMAVRSSRFIWSVNAWFARVAFERDAFDEQLIQWLETAGSATTMALRLAQALSELGRGVLRMLMIADVAASSVFLRRMEGDADRYQARVAGTGAFISTVLEGNLLALAAQRAIVELGRMKREGRLVDNYPGFIAALRGRYSKAFVQRLAAGCEEGQTGWFSAHPSDRERIALARAENCRGILPTDLPATVLFADYDALCRRVTLQLYDDELRLKREGCELVQLQSVLKELE